MLLPPRAIITPIKLILFAVLAICLGAAPGAAWDVPFQLAQLNIEIGGAKLGKKKCKKNDLECLEQHNQKKEHSDKKDKQKFLDTGIGIVIDGSKASSKKKKKKEGGATIAVKKKDKKKPVQPAKNPGDDPKDKPVFVPPEFPALAMRDCEDCYELWESILWYEFIISVDARKLFDRRQDVEDRRAEMEELRSKLPKAGSIDKVYYTQEIARHAEYIEAIDKLNDELEQLVEREWIILRERMDQYVECADRYCPILVKTEQVELTPASTAPPPEEPAAAPPAEPAASGTEYKIGTGIKLDLGLGGKTSGYGSTYGPPLPHSRPPDDPNLKICGPDITQAVINTLKKIRKDFNDNAEKQAAACRSLIDPRTGGSAWDIQGLNPAVAVPPPYGDQKPYSYEKEYDAWVQRDEKGDIKSWKQPWFTGESAMCAIPRNDPVCAPTVEFFGICEHAQVVNYVQWRFMLGLCGGAYPYVGPLLHKAWNTIQYGGNAPKQAQGNMSEVAKKVLDKLNEDENATDFSDIKDALVALDSGLSKEIRQCELKCPIKIDREFGYIWTGLTRERPVDTVRLDRDLNAMADEGIDKLKAKAEAAGYTADALRPSSVLDKILKTLGLN